MSKKDFIMVADALLRMKPNPKDGASFGQWLADAVALADAMAEIYPRFDRAKWESYLELR